MTEFLFPNMIPAKFRFDHERQLHALKHFNKIDLHFTRELLRYLPSSETDIRNRIEEHGSKFREEFLSNPLDTAMLLEKDQEFVNHYRLKTRDRIELQLVFDMVRYPEGIGYDNLAPRSRYDTDWKIKVKKHHGFPIGYVEDEARPTWEMHYIFARTKGEWDLVTVFPGKYAPPLPEKEKQTRKEYEEYAEFWKEHLFLI